MPYYLGFCEIFNKSVHGDFNHDYRGKYVADLYYNEYDELINEYHEYRDGLISWEDFYRQEIIPMTLLFGNAMNHLRHRNNVNDFIPNYNNIIISNNYSQPQIVDVFETEEGIHLCIVKTCYLRMFQRKWKLFYKKRKLQREKMKNPRAIYHRKIHGKLPKYIKKKYI